MYRPKGLAIKGISTVAPDPLKALEASLINVSSAKGVKWMIAVNPVPSVGGTLYVAVPVSHRDHHSPGDSFPSSSTIRISNGGISVYDVSGEWIGEQPNYGESPSSGVNGVQAILDFEAGSAPVTVSRNGIRISKAEAHSVVDAVVNTTCEAWEKFSKELFSSKRTEADKTRRLIRSLNNSAKPPDYRSSDWCDNGKLQEKAVSLLLEYGTLEVLDGADLDSKASIPIRELRKGAAPVLLSTMNKIKAPLFSLYLSQLADARVVVAPDRRSIDLLHACGLGWTRVRSDEDLWSIVNLKETRTWRLCAVMPPETALVPQIYFNEADLLAIGLPRRRARAGDVVGLHRDEAASIPPRVLLNEDHPIWRSLETRLEEGGISGQELEDVLQQLQAQVFDEKGKTRRDAQFRRLHTRLSKMSGVPLSVPARLAV